MIMGKVVGNIVSTRKNENIVGSKILEIRIIENGRETPAFSSAVSTWFIIIPFFFNLS